jgi:hypothetical protein
MRGCPARVDVVDDADPRAGAPCRGKRVPQVRAPSGQREACLATGIAGSPQKRTHRDLPSLSERVREGCGRMVAPGEASLSVGRYERELLDSRPGHGLGDDLGRLLDEAPQAPLLPGPDHRSGLLVVDDRRPSRGECKPSARTLTAAGDGPRRRCPAALTPRWWNPPERRAARRAELFAGASADHAPLRKEELEHSAATVGRAA